MSKRCPKPRRIFRERRKPGYASPVDSLGPCDICGAPTSDGIVAKRLEDNIAAGRPPFLAIAYTCSDCQKHAEDNPEWGEAIANLIGEQATAGTSP